MVVKEEAIILAQSDTTVGFLSKSRDALVLAKQRGAAKNFIETADKLDRFSYRIPNSKKKLVRRASKTTFVLLGKSFRISKDMRHNGLLGKISPVFSTSANLSSKGYSESFAKECADIFVEDAKGFSASGASRILKIGSKRQMRLR